MSARKAMSESHDYHVKDFVHEDDRGGVNGTINPKMRYVRCDDEKSLVELLLEHQRVLQSSNKAQIS